MATQVEQLKSARDLLLAQIVTMETSQKPDYSLEGQSFQWQQMLNGMYERLDKLNKLIVKLEPYELRSEFN